MIEKYLEEHKQIGQLHFSYLINTDDAASALSELELFVKKNLLDGADIKKSPDYLCIRRNDNKTKNIVVDQIRTLQNFLNKTSVISGQKIGVIYGADEMNINSSNFCLKLLEEPPANTHMFLISENAASVIPTIRSRCAKINYFYHANKQKIIDIEFIKPVLKSSSTKEKLDFIKKFAAKDRDFWTDFSKSMEELIIKLAKKAVGADINLSAYESELFNQLKSRSPLYIQGKYQAIKEIIDNTNNYDLDLRTSVVLLLDKMRY